MSNVVELEDVGAENRAALLAMSSMMTGSGVLALLLSLAGIYAIVSLAVSQRTREIGVRVALGADPGQVLWSVLRRSALLIGLGALVGSVGGRAFSSQQGLFVFNVPETGAWLFPVVVLATMAAGLIACWTPARRALSIQPVEALRHDS